MEYITARQAAGHWALSLRRVQDQCRAGRIEGAVRMGRDWMIPADAQRPADNRRKREVPEDEYAPLPRRSAYLIKTDLYRVPGSADAVLASLAGMPEAYAMFDSQLAYHRGEIDRAYAVAQALLASTDNPIAKFGGGMVSAYCAMYRGNIQQWHAAREQIRSARGRDEKEHELAGLCLAIVNSGIFENALFPEWFRRGCFDPLPTDSYPAARYCYAQYLLTVCYMALREQATPSSPYDIFHTFPQTCELLISQTRAEGAILAEIYLDLVCASGYHNIGQDGLAVEHIDRAIDLALPDRLYAPLAEKRNGLDFLLDERLERKSKTALREVRALNKQLMAGWTTLHNAVLDRNLCNNLTTREREVAKLAALGLTNAEIAQRLCVSLSTVKQAMRVIIEKTGARNRAEIVAYI